MRVRVGTSGFSYKEWKGTFYPDNLPETKMLRYYGERFDTVEINNTFYRMPKQSMLSAWASEVGEGFAFVLKAPQRLTHWGKLAERERRSELAEAAKYFFETAKTLGSRLGPVLVQLPPYLKKSIDKLEAFFALVPEGIRIALEVGSETWQDDEVYGVLRARGASLCIVDAPKKRTPVVATASFGYLRLRETTYGEAEIAGWTSKILAQPWSEAWVFFKHEEAGTGPRLAAAMNRALAARAQGAR